MTEETTRIISTIEHEICDYCEMKMSDCECERCFECGEVDMECACETCDECGGLVDWECDCE